MNATVTVSRGPIAYTYNGLKFTLESQCDDQIFDNVYLNVHYYKLYNITVAVNGSGTTNIPAGTYPYPDGTAVVLYASPSPGNVFQKWMVGTNVFTSQAIQVIADSNRTATAYFVPTSLTQYSLQIDTVGNGTTMPPAGSYVINQDSVANLLAIPDIYNAFVKWVINGTDVFNPDTNITITGNTTATAYFIGTHTITVSIDSGQGTNNTLRWNSRLS